VTAAVAVTVAAATTSARVAAPATPAATPAAAGQQEQSNTMRPVEPMGGPYRRWQRSKQQQPQQFYQ
jgi:hypothetical protein